MKEQTDTFEQALIKIDNLCIGFKSEHDVHTVVHNVSWQLSRREKLGIVGESGSGKSLSCRALMGVLPQQAVITADTLSFDGIDLLSATKRQYRALRGNRMGMILQDPKYSLNPVLSVGKQIIEAININNPKLSKKAAREKAISALEEVKIRDADRVLKLYPHELSGGMGQRVMIAMMVVCEPDILIADEPTSALDVTVRNQVIDILDEEVCQRGMSLVLISHDLRLISRVCDRIIVMQAGKVVETLEAGQINNAQHPYTQGLIGCLPDLNHQQSRLTTMMRSDV